MICSGPNRCSGRCDHPHCLACTGIKERLHGTAAKTRNRICCLEIVSKSDDSLRNLVKPDLTFCIPWFFDRGRALPPSKAWGMTPSSLSDDHNPFRKWGYPQKCYRVSSITTTTTEFPSRSMFKRYCDDSSREFIHGNRLDQMQTSLCLVHVWGRWLRDIGCSYSQSDKLDRHTVYPNRD